MLQAVQGFAGSRRCAPYRVHLLAGHLLRQANGQLVNPTLNNSKEYDFGVIRGISADLFK